MEDFIIDNIDSIGYLFCLLFFAWILLCFATDIKNKHRKEIKVLKRGKIKLEWYRIKCAYCSSELEFSSEHIQKSKSLDETGEPESSEYIICPVCGKKIGVFARKIILK